MTFISPDNELKRLEALLRFKILDTENEEVYNTIVTMAASIMETPIAIITFLDATRAWNKAKFGIDVTEGFRELTFCTHTILTSDPMIVEDATLDERFCSNPYVIGEPKIRFYCGVPLVTANKEAIGTICAVDSVVKKAPTKFQVESMKSLSKLVMAQLELREFIIDIHQEIEQIQMFSTEKDISKVYLKLNMKCDSILDKIKARKN